MGTYQVVHQYRAFNQQMRNVFYYVTSVGEPTNAEWQTIADEIQADWVAELLSRISHDVTLFGINRRRVDSPGLFSFDETFTSGPSIGSSAVDIVPTQVALLVSNKGLTAPPNRARTYLPGLIETQVAESNWIAAAIAAAEAFIDLQSNLNTGGTNPLSRVAARWNVAHTFVEATNDLSGAASVGSPVPATQRRRRIGVGI